MKSKGMKAILATLVLVSASSSALACVSMGASHTCNKDCKEWMDTNWFLGEMCIYGGAQRHSSAALMPGIPALSPALNADDPVDSSASQSHHS